MLDLAPQATCEPLPTVCAFGVGTRLRVTLELACTPGHWSWHARGALPGGGATAGVVGPILHKGVPARDPTGGGGSLADPRV